MFREKIQENYEDLSPRFRTLADFILENTLDVGFLTATALARRVGVDPATVVRFSQEIGYSGYRELSHEIKDYINNQLALRYKKGAPESEGLAGEIAVLADELSERIRDLKADADEIARAAKKIHDAHRIFIASETEGYGIATLWSTYLNLLDLAAQPVQAEAMQSVLFLRDATPDDLLITITLGLTPNVETGHLLNAAREQDISTIAITTSPTLLPARQADINLFVPSETPSGYPAFDTLVGILSLLWQALIMLEEEKADQSITDTMSALNTLVQQKAQVPAYDMDALLRLWKQESEPESA
jgi:DNA-binding MurR/RpiR family transcriptional regulator